MWKMAKKRPRMFQLAQSAQEHLVLQPELCQLPHADATHQDDQEEIPSHLTAAEAKGFALTVGRIVLGQGVGGVCEALHLARPTRATCPAPETDQP